MKARARAIAGVLGQGARLAPAGGLTLAAEALAARLRSWFQLELERGRAFLFLPVAFGAGILLYFAAPDEPSLAAPCGLALALAVVAWRVRARYLAFVVASALAAVAAGFATGGVRTAIAAHAVLGADVPFVRLTAWVEAVERREAGDRLTLRLISAEPALAQPIERFRATTRGASGAAVGTAVSFAARLRPPAEAASPGLFDFGRDAFFAGFGATGFIIGKVTAAEAGPPPWSVRWRTRLDAVRSAISERIRAAIPGAAGAIADALVTGKRDGIPEGLNEAMRVAGTYHILSISGFHMALVAALIFALVRGSLALVPSLALRRRVKAFAAFVALVVSTAYLVISGAEVATQRSWIMIAVVLIGVMLDRGALTLRTLALAALAVLILSPESLIGPSFQMSFAATLALVAGYGALRPWAERQPDGEVGVGRVILGLTNGVAGLATSSFVASLATTPYSAFHFNTLQLYGVPGNLLGAPLIEFIVMPLEILALMLWPFGFDQPVWAMVGTAIQWFVRLMEWVASWPGGRVVVASFAPACLLMMSVGIVVVALLTTPLRWLGIPLLGGGLALIPLRTAPDVFIDADGQSVAARAPDGTLRALSPRGNRFTLQRWLQADGDSRPAAHDSIRSGVNCDSLGCGMVMRGGDRIVVSSDPEGLPEDCREARLVVTRARPPPDCAAQIIDLRALPSLGAVVLRRDGDGRLTVRSAREGTGHRPWHRPRSDAAALPLLPPVVSAGQPPSSQPPAVAPEETDPAADQ